MKLTGSLLLLILLTSCGKNAFLKIKDNKVTTQTGVGAGGGNGSGDGNDDGNGDGNGNGDGSGDNCESKLFTSNPVARPFVNGEQPFYFRRIRLNEHTYRIRGIKGVDYGQVVLDYDLSELNNIDKKVKSIKLRLMTKQIIKKTVIGNTHQEQICHNQNEMCSGIKESVDVHIRNGNYQWINEDFSHMVNSFDLVSSRRGYSTRLVDTSFDLMPMFKAGDASDIKTKDFIDNYTVFISDRQLVTKARLNILYCE